MRARNLIDLWLVLVTRYKKKARRPRLDPVGLEITGTQRQGKQVLRPTTPVNQCRPAHVAEAEGCERPIRQLAIQGTSRKVADYAMEASEQYSIVPDLHQGSLSGMVAGRSEIPPSPRGGGWLTASRQGAISRFLPLN